MAYIDEELDVSDNQIVALNTKEDLVAILKREVWKLFEAHKNESYKGKKWGIPYSIKVAKIEPILVKFLGANPYAS